MRAKLLQALMILAAGLGDSSAMTAQSPHKIACLKLWNSGRVAAPKSESRQTFA
jgi:hypothetical protein